MTTLAIENKELYEYLEGIILLIQDEDFDTLPE